jgi:hypothetical protein
MRADGRGGETQVARDRRSGLLVVVVLVVSQWPSGARRRRPRKPTKDPVVVTADLLRHANSANAGVGSLWLEEVAMTPKVEGACCSRTQVRRRCGQAGTCSLNRPD